MRKLILTLFLILLIVLIGCKEIPEEKEVPKEKVPAKTLSELQIEACNAADEAGTCDTRLVEVGIVLPDKCCEVLRKCC